MPAFPDPRTLAVRPEYYLKDVSLETGQCAFLRLDEGAYGRSAFMDHRIKVASHDTLHVPLAVMQETIAALEVATETQHINYVLHTAFCCSTLVSRCLDIEAICYALREPEVLMRLANYKRMGAAHRLGESAWSDLLDTSLFLLAKSSSKGATPLIKPTNAANNLGDDLLRHRRTGGVLLLYSGLEQFLVSIIKKNEAGRVFVRRLFNLIRGDSRRADALTPAALLPLTDLQIAAFVWYVQMDVYLRLLEDFPQANIRTLDCEVFLAQPEATLAKLCELFSLEVEIDVIRQIVAGPVFRKYSKSDAQDYDSALRQVEYKEVMRLYQADIAGVIRWSEGIRSEGKPCLPLPRAL